MNYSIHFISLLLLASGLAVRAQEKRAMTFEEMVGWEHIQACFNSTVQRFIPISVGNKSSFLGNDRS